ncbi:MAG: hypothetical protein KDE09_00840 [Anaerolineales bacterium]|nr:hypothetical protein [Anaerolineales bacterium]MCB0016298.1 hypothetical protein [Anaerolineales bacterium]MCB8962877.1 hypothetical protein [Ardenticatenales bacterium]
MGECLVICRFNNTKYRDLLALHAQVLDPVTTVSVAQAYARLTTERKEARQVSEDLFGIFRPPAGGSSYSYGYSSGNMNEPRDGGDLPPETSYAGGTRARILTPGQTADPALVNFKTIVPFHYERRFVAGQETNWADGEYGWMGIMADEDMARFKQEIGHPNGAFCKWFTLQFVELNVPANSPPDLFNAQSQFVSDHMITGVVNSEAYLRLWVYEHMTPATWRGWDYP